VFLIEEGWGGVRGALADSQRVLKKVTDKNQQRNKTMSAILLTAE